MLILYVGMKYDYGKLKQGYSFEHYNFYESLRQMGHDLVYFDFMSLMQEHDRDWMNRRLLEIVRAEKPNLMFTVLFTEELKRKALREIAENSDTTTLNWFCDDHWRFDNYSRFWAPCFNWVVTTASSALPKYARLGSRNVIKSQWACNHFLYRKLDLPLEYDVSFIGQPHGNRRQVIEQLRDAGVPVSVWGSGWESGRLSQEEMLRVFNQSRINLNLANASMSNSTLSERGRATLRRGIARALRLAPFGSEVKVLGKGALARVRRSSSAATPPSVPLARSEQYGEQIKGRNFEVPGCGGFVLTGRADNLENYFRIGTEVVCFDDVDDLVQKIRYYLHHDDERVAIAEAGYRRTLAEHTYVHRFTEVFRRMGLRPNDTACSGLDRMVALQ